MRHDFVLVSFVALILVGCEAQSTSVDPYGIDPVEITDESFQQIVFHSELPVMLDLWAPGCIACKEMEPGIRQLAKEYEGRAVVAKLNVDQALKAARRFRLSGLPTIVFFNDGQKVDHLVGVQTLPELRRRLDQILSESATVQGHDESSVGVGQSQQ